MNHHLGKWILCLCGISLASWLAGCAGPPVKSATKDSWLQNWQAANPTWRGVHLWLDTDASAHELIAALPRLAATGANVVVVEVNYSFEFKTHPELRNRRFITQASARELAETAHRCGIRLIPEFNCLGHQSFGGQVEPLLKVHPEFNETPGAKFSDTNFYCLSWCPQAPGLNEIIDSLIDELADAFAADAIHVGMDEVYFIGMDECPRCRGHNAAELYARQVNALHTHIVGQRHWQMLMWADRVIGPKLQGFSRFDNAHNDLSPALNQLPKDIILCDWHYEGRQNYPSVPFLTGQGFTVWPAGFLPLKATRAFSDFAEAQMDGHILGYLCTTWNETSISNAPAWPPIREILPRWQKSR